MSVINTNVKSLIAQDSLRANNNKLATAMERLSTGSKVNSAKDDAAGLAIGTRMTSQVRGLNMAIKNANDGINLAQTAEGAMTEVTDMLQRMRELAVQAGNSTNTDTDRAAMNDEVNQLKSEINRIASTTQFNGMNIMDGSFQGKKLQIGNNSGQTMELGVKSVSTSSMGETAAGLAVGATKAKVQIGGASTNVADYQGASFNVNVNGVSKTVTLPVAKATTVQTAGATAALTPAATDATPDVASKAQIGAFAEKTIAVGASGAATKLEISVNGSAVQNIDISDAKYYKAAGTATGAEVVAALQAEINKNASFQGNNAVKVSLSSEGNVQFAMANGQPGTIALTATTNTLLTGGLAGAALTTTTGVAVVGGTTKDLSANTSFALAGHNLDLRASISSHGYDATKLTVDEFVTVFNDTAKVNGVQLSTATANAVGDVTFTSVPVSPTNVNANGNLTAATGSGGLGIANAGSSNKSIAFNDTTGPFGQYSVAVGATAGWDGAAAADNTELKIAVNGGNAVSLKIDAGTYYSMSDLATQVQAQIDDSGAFTGENAVTVTAVQNSDKKWGLEFSNASGEKMEVSGGFIAYTESAVAGHASGTLESTSAVQISLEDAAAANTVMTIHGNDFPPAIGASAFTNLTKDLSAALDKKFTVNVNGTGDKAIDLSTAITDLGYTASKITGDQMVAVLNKALKDAGYAGNNEVTASLDAGGHLNFQVKGSLAAGSNPSLTIKDTASGVPAFTGSMLNKILGTGAAASPTSYSADGSGKLLLAATSATAETFGTKNLVLGSSYNGLDIKVGTDAKVSLSLTAGTYNDASDLVTEIQHQIDASGAFTGSKALTVSVVSDVDGNQGFKIASATGQEIKLTGTLLSAANAGGTAGIAATDLSATGITFPASPKMKGGIDLSASSAMSLSVTNASGQVTTKSFDLGITGKNVSYADYATAMQSAANAAFHDEGITFTAGAADGKLSFAVNDTSAASFSATGAAVTSAFGGDITGTAPTAQLDVNKFTSMSDVAAAINADLGGAATAEFDAAAGWSFTVASGDAGANSTISLSGAGLSSVQFAGNLSATGAAGNATAAKLSDIDVLTTDKATAALGSIDNSIQYISDQRANLGAIQNRLEHTVNNLTNIVTNTEASRSAIMDADYSKETTNLAKSQILTQAATAMLAQANQSAQGVLSLLK